MTDEKSLLRSNKESIFDFEFQKLEGTYAVVNVQGYKKSKFGDFIFYFFCIISFGLFYLFFQWLPKLYLYMTHYMTKTKESEIIMMESDLTFEIELCKVYKQNEIRYIEYRKTKLIYNEKDDLFLPVKMNLKKNYFEIHETSREIDSIERKTRKEIYGENKMDIEMKSFLRLFFDEVLTPFYFFQIISCIIWYFDNYWIYATSIIFISFISAITTVSQTRKNLINLREMARIKSDEVFTPSDKKLDTMDLVPGDVIKIPKNFHLPCDIILLSGQCVVDESMLTGESVPVVKVSLPKEKTQIYSLETSKNVTLFSGSEVITTKKDTFGLVVRTGFLTEKGQLLLSIIYPKPSTFKFYTDSLKFVGFMFILGFLGMIYATITLIRLGSTTLTVVKKVLDIITISVPPELPIAMSSGTSFAMLRLKDKRIFCVSPPRINVAGMLNLICFDKTGTLTEDGLDLIKIVPYFDDILQRPILQPNLLEYSDLTITKLMGTCHNISTINDRFIGDPLEIKMFESTNWKYEELDHHTMIINSLNEQKEEEYTILKRYDFSSELQRMSCLVKDKKSLYIFSKGAPEKMKTFCKSKSIPHDYDSSLIQYAKKGYRVLSCAFRVEQLEREEELLKEPRDKIEKNFEFVGFLIFQNKLKKETKPTISKLNKANIQSVMITGDNIYTASCVSRECNLVNVNRPLYLGDWDEKKQLIIWKNIDNDKDVKKSFKEIEGLFELGITGKAFERVYQIEDESNEIFNELILKCKIFARMLPDQKMKLVEAYEDLEYFTGMCGDGANDIGALKSAHVGVSLSEAEASIAAPFTSSIQNISSVSVVIKEGRCALLTSFQMFKFMAMYAMIQFTAVCILYNIRSIFADMHFLYVDLFLILPISLLMGNTAAATKLTKAKPSVNLFSIITIISILGQILISFGIQIFIWYNLHDQSWFKPHIMNPNGEADDATLEGTIMFLVQQLQTLNMAIAYSQGGPFRQILFTNFFYFMFLGLAYLFGMYIILFPDYYTRFVLQLVEIPNLLWRLELVGNGGGGGERVLWCLINSIQNYHKTVDIVLYTGDDLCFDEVAKKIKKTFNIELKRKIQIVVLKKRHLLEAKRYQRFTLLLQSLASIIVGWEALSKFSPDIFIDTIGMSFTFPVAKLLAKCKVACYVHYPTISTDMLNSVNDRISTYNNDDSISKSETKTFFKLKYYQFFSKLYGLMGYFVDVCMVNSNWTKSHIKAIWWCNEINTVFPPVDVQNLLSYPIENRDLNIISVGQFRPEKNHKLQIKSFSNFLKQTNNENVKLILLGGSRDTEDEERINELKKLSKELNIESRIQFEINASNKRLTELLSKSLIGIHTMRMEHFGICIVEYQAAGLITLAHKSGGPLSDIIKNEKDGFLAESEQEYSNVLISIFSEYEKEKEKYQEIQKQGRLSSQRFSEEVFEKESIKYLSKIL